VKRVCPPRRRSNLVVADCVLGEGEAYEQLLGKHAERPLIQEAIRTIWRSLENVREFRVADPRRGGAG